MWFTPVQLTIITFFLYQELGPTSLIAIAVVATQVPLQIGLAKTILCFTVCENVKKVILIVQYVSVIA